MAVFDIIQRSHVTGLTKTIQDRELDFAIRDIADLIGYVDTLGSTIDDLSFLDLRDTPVAYGTPGDVVTVNPSGDGLIFTAPGGGADGNTWDMSAVAFVSPTGNNGTAALGDGNKPYQTIAAAQLVSNVVMILPGAYTETITLQTLTTYYCYPGVKFTAGGLRSPLTELVDTKWLGYADFVGNFFHMVFNLCWLTDFVLEFNRSVSTGTSSRTVFFKARNPSNIDVKCVSVDAFAANGHGPRFYGDVTGTFTASEYVTSDYGSVSFGGTGGYEIIRDFVYNCPRTILRNGGFIGNNAAFKAIVGIFGTSLGSSITINGDLYSDIVAPLGSISGGISNWTQSAGKVIHNGKVFARSLRGIYMNVTGSIKCGDKIESDDRPFLLANGETVIDGCSLLFSNTGQVQGTAVAHISNSTMYCDTGVNMIDYVPATADLYVNNVLAEGTGAFEFINTGGVAGSAGMINSYSNLLNDTFLTNLYGFVGFTQEINLVVPKI
jgi:hypothetical protein